LGICAIWGAPQSGKTTLAINLAFEASRRGKSTCILSPIEYSELSTFLGIKIPKEQSLQAALCGSENIKQAVFKVSDLFYVLAVPTTTDAFDLSYTSEQVKSLLDIAKATFDLVVVDCPSETNNLIAAWSLNRADNVILCLGGHISCTLWYEANKRALQTVQKKAIYVGSQTTADFDYEALYSYMKCAPKVIIPFIPEAALLQNECKLLCRMSGKKGKSYSGAMDKLLEAMEI